MKTQKLLFLFTISLIFTACSLDWTMHPTEEPLRIIPYDRNNTSKDSPSIGEPGKCYTSTMYSDRYEYIRNEIFEYTGVDYTIEGVDSISIELEQATTKWERKKTDLNCVSSNPDDCYVMCLIDVPAITQTYYFVSDTTINKQFKITEIQLKELIEKGGRGGWVEMLCEKDINTRIVQDINQELINLGYLNGNLIESLQIISRQTKTALSSYQEAHGLPIGGALNMPTLEHLGVLVE